MARGRLVVAELSPEVEVESSPSPSSNDVEPEDLPPFFNTTFSTHRVSPLYIGKDPLSQNRLDEIARRLRDVLVGDVVRGIQIGLQSTDTAVGQVGPLRTVKIRWFQAEAVLGNKSSSEEGPQSRDLGSAGDEHNDWDKLLPQEKQGLWVEIRHENASYVALLLPGLTSKSQDDDAKSSSWMMQSGQNETRKAEKWQDQFLHLPLLLLRMPLPLKNVIGEWLSSTFDCRVSKMLLGTKTIINIWESWIKTAGLPDRGPDFVITFAFNAPLTPSKPLTVPESDGDSMDEDAPQAGLRSMEITISPQDLRRFLRAGKALPSPKPNKSSAGTKPWSNDPRELRRLAGPNSDDGWAWRMEKKDGTTAVHHPFTEALAHYLNHHLALDIFHPSVRVTQIGCAGFVLGQSRVKVVKVGDVENNIGTALSKATWMFVMQLGERTRGGEVPRVFSG